MQEIVFSSAVTLEFSREYPVAAETVWRALTDSAEMSSWMGYSCTFDARPGGLLIIEIDKLYDHAMVCQVVPGRVLVTMFRETLIFQTLEEVDGSTTHRLRQVGVKPESATSFACGWHYLLDRLAGHIAGHIPELPLHGIESLYDQQFRAYAETHGMLRPS